MAGGMGRSVLVHGSPGIIIKGQCEIQLCFSLKCKQRGYRSTIATGGREGPPSEVQKILSRLCSFKPVACALALQIFAVNVHFQLISQSPKGNEAKRQGKEGREGKGRQQQERQGRKEDKRQIGLCEIS